MTRKEVIQCDDCGQIVDDPADPHSASLSWDAPEGWIVACGPDFGTKMLHFDSWDCLARYINKLRMPAAVVPPAEPRLLKGSHTGP